MTTDRPGVNILYVGWQKPCQPIRGKIEEKKSKSGKLREKAREGEKNYLEVMVIGALLGKQNCTNMMACRCS